jgi:hypothetical protein
VKLNTEFRPSNEWIGLKNVLVLCTKKLVRAHKSKRSGRLEGHNSSIFMAKYSPKGIFNAHESGL